MDCKKINNLLIDFADKQLDKEQTKIVQLHLENCNNCRREVEELAIVLNEINNVAGLEPSKKLRANFLSLIDEEKAKTKTIQAKPIQVVNDQSHYPGLRITHPLFQIAAGFAILISGLLLGLLINKNNASNDSNLLALQNEISNMKQVIMLSKLDQVSPSSRIQAVSYMEEISTPDVKVIDALIRTMNTDDNTNVRLAATNALSRFTSNQIVREALINSLNMQNDPLIQITLINIMIGLHETKAKTNIQRIVTNENTIQSVKSIAEKGLEILI